MYMFTPLTHHQELFLDFFKFIKLNFYKKAVGVSPKSWSSLWIAHAPIKAYLVTIPLYRDDSFLIDIMPSYHLQSDVSYSEETVMSTRCDGSKIILKMNHVLARHLV